jgi:hypothetical protein
VIDDRTLFLKKENGVFCFGEMMAILIEKIVQELVFNHH